MWEGHAGNAQSLLHMGHLLNQVSYSNALPGAFRVFCQSWSLLQSKKISRVSSDVLLWDSGVATL